MALLLVVNKFPPNGLSLQRMDTNTGANKAALLTRVDQALDDIRPHLAIDGGNIEVVEITDDLVVKIKWLGNCQGCNMSSFTMRAGVEETLRVKVPEVTGVIAVES